MIHFSSDAEVPKLTRNRDYDGKIPTQVIRRISLPEGYHEGLYFDGKNIWVSNGKGIETWILDPKTGEIVDRLQPVGSFTEGITPAGDGTFWMTDWDEKKLYRVTITPDGMSTEYEISLEPANPAGVLWTGEDLYVITWTRGPTGTKYHLMQLNENERMSKKMNIKGIYEPAHLAWDGEYLWITSWYNRRVYKVDINDFSVLGSFRSPAAKTTGIAWDGESFWITGTYADLYRVKIGENAEKE